MLRSGFQVLDRKLGVDVSLQMSDSKTSNWGTPTHMCNTDPSVLSQLESRDTLRLRTVLPFLMPWIPSWCSDKILVSMKEQQTNMLELSIWPGALEGHVKTGNQKKNKIYNLEEEDPIRIRCFQVFGQVTKFPYHTDAFLLQFYQFYLQFTQETH